MNGFLPEIACPSRALSASGFTVRDEALHVSVCLLGAFTAHEQPPTRIVGLEAIGPLTEIEEFTRPDDTGLEVDVRLAAWRRVDCVSEIVQSYRERHNLARSSLGVIHQRHGEVGIAVPPSLAKRCHEVTGHFGEIGRRCRGKYRRAGQLQTIGRNSVLEQRGKARCVYAGVVQLIAPSIVAHLHLPSIRATLHAAPTSHHLAHLRSDPTLANPPHNDAPMVVKGLLPVAQANQ